MQEAAGIRKNLEFLGDAAELWKCYLVSRSVSDRNKLTEYYFPWCRKISIGIYLKFKNNLIECNDVIQICTLSLISCLDKFDPSLGVPFEAYAYKRLKGSVLNETECFYSDYKGRQFDIQSEYFVDRIPRPDADSDPFDTIIDATIGLAFGAFLELGLMDASPVANSTPYGAVAQNELGSLLTELVEKLPENEKFVMKSYYYQHLNFAEIARITNKTRARISQLHSKALKKIRALYEFYTG